MAKVFEIPIRKMRIGDARRPVTRARIEQIAMLEEALDQAIGELFRDLPGSFPVEVGGYVVQWRHRPRRVVRESSRQVS